MHNKNIENLRRLSGLSELEKKIIRQSPNWNETDMNRIGYLIRVVIREIDLIRVNANRAKMKNE